MNFKNLLKGVALGGIVLGATTMFAGCNIFEKPKDDNKLPPYINQTYSSIVSEPSVEPQILGEMPIMRATTNQDWEKDVVSVKLKENNTAYLVHNLIAYQGVWTENENTEATDFDITIVDEDGNGYIIEMIVDGDCTTIKDKAGSNELVGSSPVELGKKDDILFENGLYVGLGSRTKPWNSDEYEYTNNIEGGSYTYKISDNEIYTSDGIESAFELKVECVGNQLVYTAKFDRAGEDGETNMFFVEKKGEHSAEFVEFFGDLDYVIYHVENEGGDFNRYYETKATSTTTTLKITQDMTFNATKLFKREYLGNNEDGWTTRYTYENVNMQLEIKTEGTVKLTVSGNENYNITTSGKWYVVGQKSSQGLLIVLDNKDFFDGYFALGTYDDDDITIEHLLTDEVCSYIEINNDVEYQIGWNEESELEIMGQEDWVLSEN